MVLFCDGAHTIVTTPAQVTSFITIEVLASMPPTVPHASLPRHAY